MTLDHLKAALEAAEKRGRELREKRDAMDPAAVTDEDVASIEQELDDAVAEVQRTRENLNKRIAQDKILDADPVEMPVKRDATPKGSLREERTYRPDNATGGFFQDLVMARNGDFRAFERLEKNNREFMAADDVQKRAGLNQTATTAGEFIPPLWWIDGYAAKLRAGRAITNAVGTDPLPAGTNSINVPTITTGASAAVQTDGNSVSNTDWVTSSATAQVQTIAGRTVASYQFVDLGAPGVDQKVLVDLLSAYNQALDVAVINGAVANAKGILGVTGINATVYTDASPTLAEAYVPLMQSKSLIEKLAFVSPDFFALHPSVWNNFLAGLDSQSRPLALSTNSAAFNALAGFEYAAEGLVGNLAGLPVIIDANIPTTLGGGTETAFIAMNRRGFDIWETMPSFKIADQTSLTTLQYQFVLWGYYAVMSRQPKMLAKVTGTGTIPVSGF